MEKSTQEIVRPGHWSNCGRQLRCRAVCADMLPFDVVVQREWDDMVLSISGTTDVLRVSNYFYNNTSSEYLVEAFRFAPSTGQVRSYATDRMRQKTHAAITCSGKAANDETTNAWRSAA